ncbi:hypothetical protein EWQ22_07795 [Salmonella enterica]|nr:hypothetical protein [Salmonella enterica]
MSNFLGSHHLEIMNIKFNGFTWINAICANLKTFAERTGLILPLSNGIVYQLGNTDRYKQFEHDAPPV